MMRAAVDLFFVLWGKVSVFIFEVQLLFPVGCWLGRMVTVGSNRLAIVIMRQYFDLFKVIAVAVVVVVIMAGVVFGDDAGRLGRC